MGKILPLLSFFFLTPCVIVFSIVYLSFLTSGHTVNSSSLSLFQTPLQGVAYAAIPNSGNLLEVSVGKQDGRVESVRNFFIQYHSLLADYAETMVHAADTYGVDYRLLPAISMQESGGCKITPFDSDNCYGYGIYTGHVTRFNSYEEGIDTVTHALAEHYIARGLTTPETIMQVWDPPSTGTGSWSHGVNYFINQL